MNDLEKYLRDVETIRRHMTAYEERPIVDHWVYATWGIVVIVATILNYNLAIAGNIGGDRLLVLVWLPALIVGALLETVGWLNRSRKDGTPLMTRRFAKISAGYAGVLVTGVLLVIHLVPGRITAGIILCIAALPLLMYALMSYAQLFVEAFGLMAVGLVLDIAGVSGPQVLAGAGITTGVVYGICGVHSWGLERMGRRQGTHVGISRKPEVGAGISRKSGAGAGIGRKPDAGVGDSRNLNPER